MIRFKVVGSREIVSETRKLYPAQVVIFDDSTCEVVGVGTFWLDRKYENGSYEPVFSYYKGKFSPRSLIAVDDLPF